MSRENVYEDYDKIADWFDTHRNRCLAEPKYLELLIKKKPPGKVLDLGCGMGEPVASWLTRQGEYVIGVDGCASLLEKARQRIRSGAEWILSDMRSYRPEGQFSAIILWHSLFHLSQEDQEGMIPKVSGWLCPGGVLLFTSGHDQGEVWSDNGGVSLYHASLAPAGYRALLRAHNMEVLSFHPEDPECGGATVWFCRKNPRHS